ncbi:MAG TPA: nucleotidyltransferase family protein [Rudaea sp.]|nr:nucleotidyltransferase family protein [Rudaea sp.]
MAELPSTHGLIVLAAGASRRLGKSKQLLRLHGETLVRRATRVGLATKPQSAVLVVGAEADFVYASVADLPVHRVDCVDWSLGMGASLRAGLEALPSACAGALIVLCDQPALDAPHLQQLVAAWRANPCGAAASSYSGRLGVPALLPRAWFAELMADVGDQGARQLLVRRREAVAAIVNEALALDLDQRSDLGRIDT